jgi:WhiB family redox-sensing transcriptional regulator
MKPLLPCQREDPDLWFPVGNSGPAIIQAEAAKAHCHICPIEIPCLEQAMATDSHGVWGGTTEDERRAMKARGVKTDGSHITLNRALASA